MNFQFRILWFWYDDSYRMTHTVWAIWYDSCRLVITSGDREKSDFNPESSRMTTSESVCSSSEFWISPNPESSDEIWLKLKIHFFHNFTFSQFSQNSLFHLFCFSHKCQHLRKFEWCKFSLLFIMKLFHFFPFY